MALPGGGPAQLEPPLSSSSDRPQTPGGSEAADAIETRRQRLEWLVEKRTTNLDCLRSVHRCPAGGGAFWLNCVLLTQERLRQFIDSEVPSHRPLHFFYLGLSLAKLLDRQLAVALQHGTAAGAVALVKGMGQLFEELEYYQGSSSSSSSALQSVKLLMLARPSDFLYPELSSPSPAPPTASSQPPRQQQQQQQPQSPPPAPLGSPPPQPPGSSGPPLLSAAAVGSSREGQDQQQELQQDPLLSLGGGPRIYRFGNDVAYQHLQVAPVPFPLDYTEVLCSLCHALALAYSRLLDPQAAAHLTTHAAAFEALLKVDGRVKHHVITPLAKDLTGLSTRAAAAELDWLRQDHHTTTSSSSANCKA